MKKTRGIALVEIIIGSAIIAVAIVAASTSFSTYIQYALSTQKNVQASYLLEEALEVFSFYRDQNWANIGNLSTSTTYYLIWTNNRWATTTTQQYVDGEFLRSVTIMDITRDGADNIASSGTYDPYTKKITASVSYFQGHATTTRSISTYITNIHN